MNLESLIFQRVTLLYRHYHRQLISRLLYTYGQPDLMTINYIKFLEVLLKEPLIKQDAGKTQNAEGDSCLTIGNCYVLHLVNSIRADFSWLLVNLSLGFGLKS